jgi:hypothetical protein
MVAVPECACQAHSPLDGQCERVSHKINTGGQNMKQMFEIAERMRQAAEAARQDGQLAHAATLERLARRIEEEAIAAL